MILLIRPLRPLSLTEEGALRKVWTGYRRHVAWAAQGETSAAFHRTSSIPGDWVRQQSCWSSDFFFFSPSLSMLGGYKNLLCGAIFEKGPLNSMFYGSFLLLHLAKRDCTEWGFGLVYSIFRRPLSYSLSFYRDLWIITYFLKIGVEFLS